MQTNKLSGFVLLTFLCVYLLGACGYKGPLSLPDEQPTAPPATKKDVQAGETENNTDDRG